MSYLEKPWALQIAVARCAQADGAQVTMKLDSPSAIQSTGPGEYAQPPRPRPRTRAQSDIERTKTGFIAIPDRRSILGRCPPGIRLPRAGPKGTIAPIVIKKRSQQPPPSLSSCRSM